MVADRGADLAYYSDFSMEERETIALLSTSLAADPPIPSSLGSPRIRPYSL